ncbi:pentatricopeptide repeat-containing protein at3g29290 [Phtheirospermum japonicum]|uniref:Pentatricopeptide repeat-containing protein at3g29290 n=1 Tax=Phtheirospermum japonicum TaxID=374723 RepID=A0A830D2I3_9LAMI|nr:pentatricopeptide repeat-containing protein at3g29290 [Phtheirospermum japonicum]
MPNNVSVSEEGTERVCENYPENTFPAWGDNLSDEGEIYYLEERDEETLSNRILNLSKSNKVRSALALYRSMAFSDLLPDSHACNSLLSCLLRNGKLNDALKVFDLMKKSDIITCHTYSLVLKAVARAQSSDASLKIFEEAERDEKNKKYIDTIVCNTMIAIFAKTNNWIQAERIWRSLKENGLVGTLVTYRLLICIFVRCGQNELALDAYHEMIQNGLIPSDDAMQAIIGACTKEGKWNMALSIFRNMLNGKTKPSLITCNALINSLGKAGKVELAFKVYGLTKTLLGYSPDAYTWNALIGALNRANRYTDALRLFEGVKKDYGSVLNMHIYNTGLMSCQRLGLWERAMKIIWEMENSGLTVSVTSYNLVIGACEVARKPKSAPNGSLYNAAIQGMCLRSKTNLARKLYMKMQQIGLKPDGKTRALMLQNLPKG